ncbi:MULTISPECIES: hypothetical protein [unclassified Methylobacterium]|uniref:hypothetical protein n=1 Tax=unclassified Methylobacterium TaxID=2615210 RepID=UPI001FB91783|nr:MULTISPECIES: hypothetical protein [unclassified Methylobacterium]MCJ2095567.1 hypothetical protein [Methylobacterium sp. J-072]MCJ2141621.1 hypothetical protein [Methylobacterium sp. E-066]
MVRFASIVAAAGVGALVTCGSAWAGSEITVAAIATGRLYIVGTTEGPRRPVVLENRFRTESDDKGTFQYELIYHPARCIVSATIDGKTVEAVVSNCSQHCEVVPQSAAAAGPAAAVPVPGQGGPAAAAGRTPPRSPQHNRAAIATPPARTGPAAEPSAAPAGQRAGAPNRARIERPPSPPQRSVSPAPPQARAVQPVKPARKPRPAPQEAPDDTGPPIAD